MADEWVTITEEDEWEPISETPVEGDWETIEEPSFPAQVGGALVKGTMRLGEALVDLPKHIVNQVKLIPMAAMADEVLAARDPAERATKLKDMAGVDSFFGTLTKELGKAGELHRVGQEAVLRNHPEWESEPPKNFVDLLTSPDKLVVALAESTPLLLGAGIMTAAGTPQVGAMMMYAAEGQEAYDRAKADNQSDGDAEMAYAVYAPIAAALETMQLQGIMKIGKGMFNRVLNRTAQKVGRQGIKSLTMDVIKIAAKEALEEVAQGEWGDITAKVVYDEPFGSIGAHIDRRAQEAYVGFMMGVVPGAGGAGAAKVRQSMMKNVAKVGEEPVAPPIVPEPKGPVIEEHPIEKPELIIGGIQTETIEEMVDRFPQKITDEKSLASVGNPIAAELGIDPDFIKWAYSTRKQKRVRGWHRQFGDKNHVIQINAGHWAFQGPQGQQQMKQTIVHELGHIAAPATISPSGIRWSIHHKAFKEWLAANRKVIDSIAIIKQIPISEVSQIPPATEVADKHVDPQTETDRLAELNRVTTEIDALVLRGEKPSEALLAKKQKLINLLKKEVKPKARKRMAKKKALTLGHNIPDRLGWTKEQRYEFNEKITGVKSMKRMTPAQREQVAVALVREANNAGIVIDAPESNNLDELLLKLEERKQKPALTQRDRRNMTKLRKVLHLMKSKTSLYFLHMSRMKRLCRALDNYEDNGPFTKYIFEPVKQADVKAKVNFTMVMEAGMATFNELGIDVPAMFSEVKDVGIKDKLSTAERIGIWALAQNKKTLRHLTSEFSPLEIEKIVKSVEADNKEMEVGLAVQVYFEQGWNQLQKIAAAHGIKGLVKEENYITAFVKPTDDVVDAEFMEGLLQEFTQGKFVPGQQHTIARKRGAKRNLELNVFMIHARAAKAIERFKVMAPVADEVGNVLKHGAFKDAINNATYGHGAKLFQKWLQDSIRGHAAYEPGPIASAMRWLRMRSVHYVLGFKVLTAAKQGISLFPAMSVHPGMIPLVVANLTHNPYSDAFKAMRAEALVKSEILKTRDWNRDLRQVYNQKTVQRMYAGKKLSPVLMRMATAVDSYTVTVAWNAAYRLARKQDGGMNEVDSVRFADGVIQNTQPMGSAVDLPAFFRGSELEKNLSIFQNQVNQNGNMFWYDILGETKARKISLRRTGYRLLMSQMLPALLLGLVSRGRLPRDLGEIGKDMAFYLLSPYFVFGRLIYNMAIAREWGPTSGFLFETPVTETYRTVGAIMEKDPGKVAKYGARAVGAWSGGYPPLQVVQTAEGAWNLATGDTDDFRELIWSKYALGKKKGKKRGTETGRGF